MRALVGARNEYVRTACDGHSIEQDLWNRCFVPFDPDNLCNPLEHVRSWVHPRINDETYSHPYSFLLSFPRSSYINPEEASKNRTWKLGGGPLWFLPEKASKNCERSG